MPDVEWESRVDAVWAELTDENESGLIARLTALTDELAPEDDAVAAFELGGGYDSTGHPEEATELYRAALAKGLDGLRRRRATIQLASSLRNLGKAAEAEALLRAELDGDSDELDDAVRVFYALTLTSLGRDRDAAAVALQALSAHLTRYRRSATAYADELRASAETPRAPSPGRQN